MMMQFTEFLQHFNAFDCATVRESSLRKSCSNNPHKFIFGNPAWPAVTLEQMAGYKTKKTETTEQQ